MTVYDRIGELSAKLFVPYSGNSSVYTCIATTAIQGLKETRDKSELGGLILKKVDSLSEKGKTNPDTDLILELVDVLVDDFFEKECRSSMALVTRKQERLSDAVLWKTKTAQ